MVIFPFGKYKGLPVEHIPRNYAEWLRREVPLEPRLADAMESRFGGRFRRKVDPWAQPTDPPASAAEITTPLLRSMRRKWSTKLHPDRGGSPVLMSLANQIFDDLEAEVTK